MSIVRRRVEFWFSRLGLLVGFVLVPYCLALGRWREDDQRQSSTRDLAIFGAVILVPLVAMVWLTSRIGATAYLCFYTGALLIAAVRKSRVLR